MGGVRTALYNFLYARKHGGTFALRIEDTDVARNKEECAQGIVEDLAWLGLTHDTFAKQSERTELYRTAVKKLIDSGHAYISQETPTEEGQRDSVVRFKNPNTTVIFTDLIRGEISVDTTDLKDFVIARSVDEPLYHLAVVVDDADMGITHVVRAEEHLSNTPRQILILEALSYTRPTYAHIPLVLAPDKSKLSKRKHGESVSLSHYRSLGYLPHAILNFLLLIGWNPGTDQEFFTLDDMITQFDLTNVQKGGAVFNVEKLDWINKHYIAEMSPDAQFENINQRTPQEYSRDMLKKIQPLILDRIHTFGHIPELFETGEFAYFFSQPTYNNVSLTWKEMSTDEARMHLQEIFSRLEKLSAEAFSAESVKSAVWDYAEEKGRGNVLWPLRVALAGLEKSVDPFTIAGIIGKEETLARISNAVHHLS
jgi:glutamyl-tRNA synthetase